jgi:hypothetical protein
MNALGSVGLESKNVSVDTVTIVVAVSVIVTALWHLIWKFGPLLRSFPRLMKLQQLCRLRVLELRKLFQI